MKRRNREINIFNMSLLDILCGALGAFCFMMLSLLPYYRPPGKDINITKEQKDLLDEVQKIKDLAERLKNTSRAEDLRELVRQLREQITALENRIKQLQGQVNALYAENDELKTRVAKLEVENGLLRSRNEKLEQENQRLQAEKQQLLAEKQQLQQEKQELEGQLAQRMPWTVSVTPDDARAVLDCSLHEQKLIVITNGKEGSYPEFDPTLPMQPTIWTGDMRLNFGATVTRLTASRMVGSEANFYIKVISRPLSPGQNFPVLVKTEVSGARLDPVSIRQLPVPSDRNWIFAGKFRVESATRIAFTEATPTEREAEWQRLEKRAEPPQITPTPAPQMLTDAVMGPGFEQRKKDFENRAGPNVPPPVREGMLQLWLADSRSPQERKYVGELLARLSSPDDRRRAPPPGPSGTDDAKATDVASRRGQYIPAINCAASKDEKIALLRKWMNEATTDSERDFIRQMLQRTNTAPAPSPAVPPGMSREQAIEEFRKRGENQTPPPKPTPGPPPQQK